MYIFTYTIHWTDEEIKEQEVMVYLSKGHTILYLSEMDLNSNVLGPKSVPLLQQNKRLQMVYLLRNKVYGKNA